MSHKRSCDQETNGSIVGDEIWLVKPPHLLGNQGFQWMYDDVGKPTKAPLLFNVAATTTQVGDGSSLSQND